MYATFALAISLLAAPSQVAPDSSCIDPATPLRTLALAYDRWPAAETPLAKEAWSAFRRYLDSGDPDHNRKAALRYRSLLEVRPSDLSIVLPLGMLYAMGPDLNYPEARGYRSVAVSSSSLADSHAARLLLQAVERDSTQWLAAVALARIGLASPERERRAQAERAVRRALLADPRSVVLNLALRDLLVDAGDFAGARAVADSLAQRCAPVLHARGESLILTGDSREGASLYLAGLEAVDARQLSRYEEDVWLMLTRPQRDVFERVPRDSVAGWLRRFWERSAALGGISVQDRIARQLSAVAWSNVHSDRYNYPASSDRPIGFLTDTIHREPWAHREIINARLGTPGIRLSAEDPPVRYEMWIYRDEEKPWVLLFSASTFGREFGDREQASDRWDLVVVPGCGPQGISFFGPSPPMDSVRTRAASGATLRLRELYMLAAEYDPVYADLVKRCMSGAFSSQALLELPRHNRELWKRLSWSESGGVHYGRKLKLFSRTYQFFTADRRPDFVTLTWIPTEQLKSSDSTMTRLRVSHVISDSLITSVRADTTLAASLPREPGLLRVAVRWPEVPVTAGLAGVTVLDAQDSTIGGRVSARFSARRASGRVVLSDLVLAEPEAPGPLVRASHRISPLPANELRVGDAVRLYFEVYGASAGDPVETRLHLERIDRSGLGPLRKLFPNATDERILRYSSPAEPDAAGITPEDLVIQADLLPGEYVLEVEVKTRAGVARHQTRFTVLAPAGRPQ